MLHMHKLIVIASALLGLGSAAVVFTGPAYAATSPVAFCDTTLHSGNVYCAGGIFPDFVTMGAGTGTLWAYHPSNDTTEFRLGDSQDCMQVIPSSTPPNRVRVAACDGGTDQMFIPVAQDGGHSYIWDSGNDNQCLNDHWQVNELNVAPCTNGADQIFDS
jgi:hypothetical protein